MEVEPDHDTDAMDEEPENDTGDNIPVMIPMGTDVTQTLNQQDGHQNGNRKRIMSQDEEKQRRASIRAILADDSITPAERRRSIQSLMDGRRSSVGTSTSISTNTEPSNADIYGYGDTSLDEHADVASNVLLEDLNDSQTICIPISNENTKRAETTRPPCNHYVRNCTLIAPCCGAAFGCRICHDDSPILPPTLIVRKALNRVTRSSSMPGGWTSMEKSTPQDTHHTIDRFKVSEIICRVCYTKQSSKTYVSHGGDWCIPSCLTKLYMILTLLVSCFTFFQQKSMCQSFLWRKIRGISLQYL